MSSPRGQVAEAGVEHMSTTARSHLPPHLLIRAADQGVYSETGLFGAGPGWYHLGSSADQIFLGHPGEADYFVFDFGVTASGAAVGQGFDVTTHFERGVDGIIVLNSFAVTGPGESFGVVAEGAGPRGRLDDGVDYTLVQLRFEGPVAVQTELAGLGGLGFAELV
jgi:hypothetical protein